MNEQPQHFRIRETELDPETIPRREVYIQQEKDVTLISTSALWVFSSWSIVFINIVVSVVSIRDMLSTTYNPMIHWFMSAVFVATIGGLVAIHQFIIKRK